MSKELRERLRVMCGYSVIFTVASGLVFALCALPFRPHPDDMQSAMRIILHQFMLTPAFLKFCLGCYLGIFVLVRSRDPVFFARKTDATDEEIGIALACLVFAPLTFTYLVTFSCGVLILTAFHNLVLWPHASKK